MTPRVEGLRFSAKQRDGRSCIRRSFVCGLWLLLVTARVAGGAQTGPGFALNFDGVAGYVQLQHFLNFAPTNEITIEFWQKVNAPLPQCTFCQSPPPVGTITPNSVMSAQVPFADGQVYWDFGNITLGGRLVYMPPPDIINTWQHFAFVASQSGNYMAIYRNGNLEAIKSGMTPLVHTNLDLDLSGVPSGLPYGGSLEEFRIWRVARIQDDIVLNMHRAMTGTESNLVLCLHFNEGDGPVTEDATGNPANLGILSAGVSWQHSTAPFVPEVTPLAAALVSNNAVVFNARINPDSLPTTGQFEWGPSMAMGNVTPSVNVGSNSLPSVFSAPVSGLTPGTTYYYRADAGNQGGTINGQVQTLSMPMMSVGNAAVTNSTDNISDPQSIRYLVNHITPGHGIIIPSQVTGSIYLSGGPLVIGADMTITGNCNAVLDGLGTYQAFTPITNKVTLGSLIFSNCFGANGGAFAVAAGGSVTLDSCTFIGNTASSLGGAISVSGSGTLVLNNCTLVLNQATNGGAIDTFGDTTLTSCTIVSNLACANGGGLHLEGGGGSSLAVYNCTIAGNRAYSGGGIEDDAGSLAMQDSIVANNSLSGGSGPDVRNSVNGFYSSGYNLISRDDGSSGWKHSNSPDDDLLGTISGPLNPLLARLDNYGGCPMTMELLPGSPAIDTGSSGNQSKDERSFTRPVDILGLVSPPGDSSDIGAFEVQTTDLTNAPTLTILPAGTNAIVLWSMLAKAYTLEQTSALHLPSWAPFPTAPYATNNNQQLAVTVPDTNGSKFYRLRAP
jgi:predicted outer membrane repeat protein